LGKNKVVGKQRNGYQGSNGRRLRDFGREIKRRLTILLGDLPLYFSMIIAKLIVKRELKRREAQRREVSHKARKRKLLIALHEKISEKRQKRIRY
jgi:hypothetical protein